MLKSAAFFLLSFLFSLSLFSQLHDNVLITGLPYSYSFDYTTNSIISFDSIPPKVSFTENLFGMRQCGLSISDSDGKLLFYTNCQQVATSDNLVMENGDSLNFESNLIFDQDTINYEYYLNSNGYGEGSVNVQGAIALPEPSNEDMFYLFHVNVGAVDGVYTQGTHLLCSKINMTKNSEQGKVIEKNTVVIEDLIFPGGLNATKHANGRDWWLIVFRFGEPGYYKILVGEGGVKGVWQEGLDVSLKQDDHGPSSFSPNGNRFALVASSPNDQEEQSLYAFDFDRCSGLLSNSKKILYTDWQLQWGGYFKLYSYGCTFSPNSRYLYISDRTNYLQLDMWSDDLHSSMVNFADNDGFWDLWGPDYLHTFDPSTHHQWSYFGYSGLAPDGRVYATTVGLTRYFHVIERPNNPGVSCKMEQHSFKVLGINQYSYPNHPNYRLGPLEGSGCDTLGIKKDIFIHAHPYPNEGCVGGEAHFEVTAFGTGKTYQWQASNDGNTWENLTGGQHFTGTATEYMVVENILQEHDGMQFRCIVTGNAGTQVSRPATLGVIGSPPVAAFTFEQDIDSLHFTSLSEGHEYVEYFFGDGESSTNPDVDHLFLDEGTYTVMLIATNACGRDTATAEVYIEPIFAVFEADRTQGCAPFDVTFTSRSPYRVITHQFTMDGAWVNYQSGRLREATVTYSTPGVFDTKLKVYGLNGEVDEITLDDYITVLQGINPTAEIELQQNGNTVQLNAPFDLADSYTWIFNNGETLTGQMAEYTFDAPGLYQIQLETTNHCGSATGSTDVLIGGPQAAFTVDQQQGCVPFIVQFENTTDFFGASYKWQFPDGLPATSSEENPVVEYEIPGIYEVVLIAHADSLSDTLVQAAYIEVLPDDCLQPNIFVQANGLDITAWTNCTDGTAYTWQMGDGTTISTQGAAHKYGEEGTYEITLLVESLCGIDTVSKEVNITGPNAIGVSQHKKYVSLVPNPASSHVQVISENGFPSGATLQVFNALGIEVVNIEKASWRQQEAVSLEELPTGAYFFRFESGNGQTQVGKLVVE